jgi:hypothetical protein
MVRGGRDGTDVMMSGQIGLAKWLGFNSSLVGMGRLSESGQPLPGVINDLRGCPGETCAARSGVTKRLSQRRYEIGWTCLGQTTSMMITAIAREKLNKSAWC